MKFAFHHRRLVCAALLTAYGTLLWQFLRFLEIDSCADAGGVIDAATSNCTGFRPDEFLPLSNRPVVFWFVVAIVPALPISVVMFLLRQRATTLEK